MFTSLDAEQAAVDAADAAARAVASVQAQAARSAQSALPVASQAASQAGTPSASDAQPGGASNATVYQWLVAWLVVILFGILIARTRIGYTMLYYMAALSLLLLLLTNSSWIAAAVRPITGDMTREEQGNPVASNIGFSEPGGATRNA